MITATAQLQLQSLLRLCSSVGFSYDVATQWSIDVVLGIRCYTVDDEPTLDRALFRLIHQLRPTLEAMLNYSPSAESKADVLLLLTPPTGAI